jgi:hypothetical protein
MVSIGLITRATGMREFPGVDLFWWFGRAALYLALRGSGPLIIDRLAEIAAVVSSVGHNIARDMEQGLTLRY